MIVYRFALATDGDAGEPPQYGTLEGDVTDEAGK